MNLPLHSNVYIFIPKSLSIFLSAYVCNGSDVHRNWHVDQGELTREGVDLEGE